MADDFNASKPIYMQLADRINRQILRKELVTGQKLPSVREMAIQSGVNPNTVQRTYSELERMGSVESKRGQGTFVTENQSVLNELRQNLKKEQISSFFADMKEMGFSAEEMMAGLQEFISSEESGEQRD
ncbi:GntR family transcriptional regulator [Fictibacillus sp. WQ 8-8]|uniref:GntR family transcriptional regulator n=1 Tax=Fictibacillus marinisediminis TaxID=2878389 RepID=A0A9X2BDA8_9BACL|nr:MULTISPECIES: GntR family transcriptional regulator [Fictibacillus]MCK6256495.1 GntR family transcriptional regulator [Fictibacillus marinisediminis]MCQ6265288.1 GntR family transcriptional regulator [Fictibacillus sp. WQ 8-8]MED2971958.1 GntR family transcriptional regulator [Fictibacillus sp. B-59209]SFE01418.1 DNA-binding transcriptional regulator YhcF, GntR family [Bacillus sp. OV194]